MTYERALAKPVQERLQADNESDCLSIQWTQPLCGKLGFMENRMIDLKQYGYSETKVLPEGIKAGRVTEVHRNQYMVITEHGEVPATLKGSFVYDAAIRADLPCTGDFVHLQYNISGPSLITQVLPRHSKFSRADSFGHAYAHIKANREQVVATNFDYVFILTSLNRDFRVARIMRYLTQTRQSGGQPVVLLTKADLTGDFNPQLNEVKAAAPDVPVHVISSHTRFGFETLGRYLKPEKTIVFLGMSGVGKSSLLNALADDDLADVRETRKVDSSKGSHTTTHRQLFMLPSGAMVIDTPGMREIGLYDAEESISEGFADVEELFAKCRFSDCRHEKEPGCAVRSALADGSLPREHWKNYLTQRQADKFTNDKASYYMDKRAQHKSLARWSKQMKKNGGFKR